MEESKFISYIIWAAFCIYMFEKKLNYEIHRPTGIMIIVYMLGIFFINSASLILK